MVNKFEQLQVAGVGESGRETLGRDINAVVVTLQKRFSTLERIVSRHDDENSFNPSIPLWSRLSKMIPLEGSKGSFTSRKAMRRSGAASADLYTAE